MGSIALAAQSPRSPTGEVALVVTVALAVGGAIAALCFAVSYLAARVGVSLDASGRWVTLRNVHPAFAAAVASAPQPDRHRRTEVNARPSSGEWSPEERRDGMLTRLSGAGDFEAFYRREYGRVRALAIALCGDRGAAEDLVTGRVPRRGSEMGRGRQL